MHLVQLCILVALLCSDTKDVGNKSDTSPHGALLLWKAVLFTSLCSSGRLGAMINILSAYSTIWWCWRWRIMRQLTTSFKYIVNNCRDRTKPCLTLMSIFTVSYGVWSKSLLDVTEEPMGFAMRHDSGNCQRNSNNETQISISMDLEWNTCSDCTEMQSSTKQWMIPYAAAYGPKAYQTWQKSALRGNMWRIGAAGKDQQYGTSTQIRE